jgi:hypothetical protein
MVIEDNRRLQMPSKLLNASFGNADQHHSSCLSMIRLSHAGHYRSSDDDLNILLVYFSRRQNQSLTAKFLCTGSKHTKFEVSHPRMFAFVDQHCLTFRHLEFSS